MRHALLKLWLRVQEPRALSAIYFFAYLAVTVLGLAVMSDPPRTIQGTLGQTLVACWAGMLVVGGGIGACTVLQGVWWLERAGAILCMFAMGIYGTAYWGIPISQVSLRVASICFVVFAILAFAARLVKTRHYAYDPEK
ncbi:hypothetical protein [Arthrobacter sp. UYCu712]|uniref:hypothetical protein n=1 Tax=Arthrobacter sp. UYCu712 TaxID=3156340 RepID=UPI0033990CA2